MDENDILIDLTGYLIDQSQRSADFIVNFEDTDGLYGFPSGNTKTHLATAAKDAGVAIVRCGESKASLRRVSDFGFA